MPIYSYRCPDNHTFETFNTIRERQDVLPCQTCSRPARQLVTPTLVNGCMMSEKTREILSSPFGRKKAGEMREARDVEKALDNFHKRYPYLGRPEGT